RSRSRCWNRRTPLTSLYHESRFPCNKTTQPRRQHAKTNFFFGGGAVSVDQLSPVCARPGQGRSQALLRSERERSSADPEGALRTAREVGNAQPPGGSGRIQFRR